MKRIELLKELQKLTPAERLAVIEAALQQLRADLEGVPASKSLAARKQEMAAAAQALLKDYALDAELTAFTVADMPEPESVCGSAR